MEDIFKIKAEMFDLIIKKDELQKQINIIGQRLNQKVPELKKLELENSKMKK